LGGRGEPFIQGIVILVWVSIPGFFSINIRGFSGESGFAKVKTRRWTSFLAKTSSPKPRNGCWKKPDRPPDQITVPLGLKGSPRPPRFARVDQSFPSSHQPARTSSRPRRRVINNGAGDVLSGRLGRFMAVLSLSRRSERNRCVRESGGEACTSLKIPGDWLKRLDLGNSPNRAPGSKAFIFACVRADGGPPLSIARTRPWQAYNHGPTNSRFTMMAIHGLGTRSRCQFHRPYGTFARILDARCRRIGRVVFVGYPAWPTGLNP